MFKRQGIDVTSKEMAELRKALARAERSTP